MPAALLKRWTEDVIAEGDRVVLRCVYRGTHTGEFMGIPPTGKAFQHGQIVIRRITEGKIVESWNQEDNLWMMQQLGLELKPIDLPWFGREAQIQCPDADTPAAPLC